MNDNKIFISFSNANHDIVSPIVETLEDFPNVKCWFQPKSSKKDFHREIPKAIEGSNFFICFVSHASMQSLRVNNEIEIALDKKEEEPSYTILPIGIEDLTSSERRIAKGFFGSFTWLFKKNYKDIHSLVLTIFSHLGIQPDEANSYSSIYTGDEQIEIKRIKLQNEYLNRIASPYLDTIFSQYNNPTVLDIGCADGENTILRLQSRKYDSLLGIDKNKDKINSANFKFSSDRDKFLVCDIESNELDAVLTKYLKEHKTDGFDIVHIAAVLMHTSNPGEIIKKLYKYISPKGTIFIQDEDDGLNISYPNNKLLESCRLIWKHSKESGDRSMGRKIPKFLTDSGFTDIHLLSSSISSLDFDGETKEELWDIYYNSDLWVTDSPYYFDSIEAYNACMKYKENHAKLKEEYLNGGFFITLGILFFSARKPK